MNVKNRPRVPSKPKTTQSIQPPTITPIQNSEMMSFVKRTLRSAANKLSRLRTFAWDHSFGFSVVWSFIVAAPPFFVVNYFNNAQFAFQLTEGWPRLASFLASDPIMWTMAAALWIPLIEAGRRWIISLLHNAPVSWVEAPQILLAALDTVVSCKEKRFKDVFQAVTPPPRRRRVASSGSGQPSNVPPANDIFERITKPEAQIERLVTAVYTTFDSLTREKNDRPMQTLVSLALVRHGRVEEIPHCFPKSHQLPSDALERLSTPNSALMSAVRSNTILIIPSTFDELEKRNGTYVRIGDATDTNDGAHICFPIQLAEPDVAFVLSIFYPRRDAFQKRHHALYEEVLKRFGLRLRLEYNLLLLKGLHP